MNPDELWKTLGIDLVKDAPDLEPVDGEHEFRIFTRDREGKGLALKTWKSRPEGSDEDDMFLSGIASSTIKDHHGDTMLPTALIDMERDAQNNLTIFGNHEYKVPEDVYASVRKASIADSGVTDAVGSPLYDLMFEEIRVNRRNSRAVESWQAMDDGVKLGLSIGAKIPEGGAVRNKKTGALLIAHVKLLETSIVGIPANPRSWIDAATKSLKSGPKKTFQGVDLPPVSVEEIEVPIAITLTTTTPETNVSDDTVEKSTDPDATTDAESQDLDKSAPENDEAVATPDVIAAASDALEQTETAEVPDEVKDLFTQVHNALTDVTNQLIEVEAARAAAEQRAETAEAERDAMKTDTENVIAEVANLIEQVGKLPAGRQASFKNIALRAEEAAVDWEQFGFAPEVVRMLKRGPQE